MLTYNTVRLVFLVSSLLILDGMMVTYGCDLSTFCSVCAFFNLQTSRKDHGSCCKLATFMLTDLQSLHLGSSSRNGQCSTWCTSHPPWCSRRPMGTHVGTTIGTAFRVFSILVNGGRYSKRYLRWETSSVPEAFGLVTYCVFSVNMCMYYVMYYVMYSYRTHDVSWHIWSSKIVVGCLMRSVSSPIFSQAASQTRYFVPPTVPFVEIRPSPFSPVVCWATGLPCLPRWSLPWYCSMVESWPWKDLLKWLVSVVYSLQSEGKNLIMKS